MTELFFSKAQQTQQSPIKRDKMATQVMDCLMNWIMDGTLKMGDKLNTVEIADRLGVSRMPVREALNTLERKGLAVSEPHVGMRLIRLTRQDVFEIYQIRQLLEPQAAYYACRNVTPALLEELEAIHRQYQKTLEPAELSAKAVHLVNRRFHFTIYYASGMPRICQMIENVWDSTSFFKMLYGETFLKSADGKKYMIAEHQQYIDYLRTGRAELLRDTVRMNISDKLTRYMDNEFASLD